MKKGKGKGKPKGGSCSHTKVVKGVYITPSGKYVVRPTIDGKRIHVSFTNKAKAIKYYNSL